MLHFSLWNILFKKAFDSVAFLIKMLPTLNLFTHLYQYVSYEKKKNNNNLAFMMLPVD